MKVVPKPVTSGVSPVDLKVGKRYALIMYHPGSRTYRKSTEVFEARDGHKLTFSRDANYVVKNGKLYYRVTTIRDGKKSVRDSRVYVRSS